MTPSGSDHHLHLPETVRRWPLTTVYLLVAVTGVLGLTIWDRLDGHARTVCKTAAAILTGS